jgi:ribosome recycling factor
MRVIEDIKEDAEGRMKKSLEALASNFNKIRTGRAHPSILDSIVVSYHGVETRLSLMANISVLDARTLSINPWEKQLVPEIEKAIIKSDLGLNPSTIGGLIRLSMPSLTEETRKKFIKHAKAEAETARVSIRNARRDAVAYIKDLLKDNQISEDEGHRGQDIIQKLTDKFISRVDQSLMAKEEDLLEI